MTAVDLALYETTNTGSSLSSLASAFDAQWQDVPNGTGSFSFELPLGHADVALCTYGRVVRFLIGTDPVFAGVITSVKPAPVSVGDEGSESVRVAGKGLVVELDHAKTTPKPGASTSPGTIADVYPPIDDRPMEWYGMDYDDSSAVQWVASTVRGTHGEASAVNPGLPGGMRVLGAKWIWSADVAGPEDDFLFFRRWVYLTADSYVLDFACYDAAAFINGKRWPRNCALGEKERAEFTVLNAGWVLLAFEADLRDTNYDEGLVWQLTRGAEGAVVEYSDTTTKVYYLPDAVLSMTSGGTLLALKQDHPSLTEWTFNFTATTDSASADLSDISSVAVRVGEDSIWDVLVALSEVYIDFDVDVAGKTLSIWEKGTHGNTSTVDLIPGNSTAASSGFVNIVELEWEKRRAPFNALMVRYEQGWFRRPASLPAKPRYHSLGIPHVGSGAVAIQFADAVLSKVGVDTEVATVTLVRDLPTGSVPYTDFDKWSTMDVPSSSDLNTTTAMPVKAITCKMDRDGELDNVVVEFGSLIEDIGTQLERWIARSTRGGLSGLVQMAQGVSSAVQQRPPKLTQTEIVLFDSVDSSSGDSASRTMPGKGVVHKLIARVEDAAGGTSTVAVTINGVLTTLTGTTGAGFAVMDYDEGLGITFDPRTVATASFTTVGHTKITIYAAVSETR